MPWWLWLFIAYWLITGPINVRYWWDLGSMLEFAFFFAIGFVSVPVMLAYFSIKKALNVVWETLKVVRERRALRKAKKLQKLPVLH